MVVLLVMVLTVVLLVVWLLVVLLLVIVLPVMLLRFCFLLVVQLILNLPKAYVEKKTNLSTILYNSLILKISWLVVYSRAMLKHQKLSQVPPPANNHKPTFSYSTMN